MFINEIKNNCKTGVSNVRRLESIKILFQYSLTKGLPYTFNTKTYHKIAIPSYLDTSSQFPELSIAADVRMYK